jgi:SAM-dependent methyltransferase
MTKFLIKVFNKLHKLILASQLNSPYFNGNSNYFQIVELMKSRKFHLGLDLGSGPNPNNIFEVNNLFGVDIRSYEINHNVFKCDLSTDKLPFPDSHFDCITAFDLLEHIPRVNLKDNSVHNPFVELMNEIWRVLKEDGYFFACTPCFPMKEAFQDPTHVNIMTEDTVKYYFCNNYWARIYGYEGSFEYVNDGWKNGTHHYFLIKKNSNTRVVNKDTSVQL